MRTTIVVVVVLMAATAALAEAPGNHAQCRRGARVVPGVSRQRHARRRSPASRRRPCRSLLRHALAAVAERCRPRDPHPHPAGYAARDRRQEDRGESLDANDPRNRTGAAASTCLTRTATSTVRPAARLRHGHPAPATVLAAVPAVHAGHGNVATATVAATACCSGGANLHP